MEYNLKQLELWYEDIKNYEKLSIKQVKSLIKKIDDNPKNKDEIRNKIICGTLYVVYELIKKSNLIYINPQIVDINDIINSTCELWIEIIDNKTILNVNTFNQLFGLYFYKSLSKSLGIEPQTIDYESLFLDMLQWFIIENQNKEILYKDFLEEIDKRYVCNISLYLENLNNAKMFSLIKASYEFLKKDTTLLTSDKNISIRQLKFIKSFIIENIKNLKINLNEMPTEDNIEHILELILHKQFYNFVFNGTILTEVEKDAIHHIYGFEGKIFSRREFARKIGKSVTRVSQIEKKALRKLRRNFEIKKLITKGEYHG